MSSTDQLVALLGPPGREPLAIERPAEWLRAEESWIEVESARMNVRFPHAPTAWSLATAVLEIDRESRRVVTAIRRGMPPVELFGRGRRLEPVRCGLVVEEARAGSLEVMLGLGALYEVVTSQPLSFMLNTASLLGYGRLLVRATKAGGEAFLRELLVGRTEPPPAPPEGSRVVIPTPYGDAVLSDRPDFVTLKVRTGDATVEYEARRDRA